MPLQKIPNGDPTTTEHSHHLLQSMYSVFVRCMILLLAIVYMICFLLA